MSYENYDVTYENYDVADDGEHHDDQIVDSNNAQVAADDSEDLIFASRLINCIAKNNN